MEKPQEETRTRLKGRSLLYSEVPERGSSSASQVHTRPQSAGAGPNGWGVRTCGPTPLWGSRVGCRLAGHQETSLCGLKQNQAGAKLGGGEAGVQWYGLF